MATRLSERTRTVMVPFVLLAAPIAWLLSLSVSYVAHDFACSAAETSDFGVSPEALRVALAVPNVILFAVAAAAGIAGLRMYRASRRSSDPPGTTAFVGMTGFVSAVLFVFGIALITVNLLIFAAC